MRLKFSNGKLIDLFVVAAELATDVGCIIGRDILGGAKLDYDGPANEFSLTFAR